jgi:16S rRNA (cytosine967-C5)-methyltransferase
MNARELALCVVRDVFPPDGGEGRSAQEALDYHLRKTELDARDGAFATELAYGAIKMRRALDWYLEPYIGERRKTLQHTTHEILRLAVYELRYTKADEHATVHEFVELAKRHGHRGLANLANAVLRTMLRDTALEPIRDLFENDDDYLGTKHSLPTWLVRQWRNAFGDERVEEICRGVNLPAQTALVANTAVVTPENLLAELHEREVECERSPFVAESLIVRNGRDALRMVDARGRWWVQSESSAIVVEVLQPQPGETVLDACSGRGNKALQIAARASATGEAAPVTCVDRDARKMRILERRFAGHNMRAQTLVADATDERILQGARFDRILLDALCSGIGVIGRHPEARWKKQSTDGARLAPLQRSLLEAAIRRLHPGGVLVYAVCSSDRREGMDVVDAVAARNNVSRGLIPAALEPFLTERGDVVIPPGIEERDGFYIARLEAGT